MRKRVQVVARCPVEGASSDVRRGARRTASEIGTAAVGVLLGGGWHGG
jgi:hypothetical protein